VPPRLRVQLDEQGPDTGSLTHFPELPRLRNLTVQHYVGNPVVVHQLYQLPIKETNATLILADDEADEAMESDSVVLTALLHYSMHDENKSRPVCEVLDWRSERIVRKSEALKSRGHFVRSGELETGVFALCAHSAYMPDLMRGLLSLEGGGPSISQIYASVFVPAEAWCSFQDMANMVRVKGDTLLGYSKSDDRELKLNPEDKEEVIQWSTSCLLIVVSRGMVQL